MFVCSKSVAELKRKTMLFYLLSWIVLCASGAAIGSAILTVTKSAVFHHSADRTITAIWLGLLTVAASFLGLSVAWPLSPVVSMGLLAILTVAAVSIEGVRRDLQMSVRYLKSRTALALGIVAITTALNSTRLVEAFDTGLYHYQQTRWLSRFGTIPGLALLHFRFGFSSSWFALAAPFDSGPFQGRVAGLVGGLAIFLSLVHFGLAVARILEDRADEADWFLAGGYTLVFLVCFSWAYEVSLSPDLPVWILTLLTGWLMLLTGRGDRVRDAGLSSILPLILASVATGLKLSAIPLAVMAWVFYWSNSTLKLSTRVVCGALASLAAAPVIVANVVSSGCPVYPNPFLCLNVPWGIGKAGAQLVAADTVSWARWGGPAPPGTAPQNWILPWILHMDKLLLISFCAVCLLGFLAARGWRANRALLYVLGLSLVGCVFVFVTAPNPRFGAGYLSLFPALFLAAVGSHIKDFIYRRLVDAPRFQSEALAYLLVGIAVLVGAQGVIRELRLRRNLEAVGSLHMTMDSHLTSRLVLPPRLAQVPGDAVIIKNRRLDRIAGLELTIEHSNGIEYRRPLNGEQCWAAVLPCLPTVLDGGVRLRSTDNGLRSGFIRVTNSPYALTR
jgi:hypothetical protein